MRAQKTRDQASKAAQTLASSELKAQDTVIGWVRSIICRVAERGDNRFARHAERKGETNRGNLRRSGAARKGEAQTQQPRALDDGSAPVSANEQRSVTRVDSSGTVANAAEDVLHQYRKRTIMGRYVFGDELKPGERWKRRLSKGR